MLFLGFHGTFLIQHWLGVSGMPRRYADYLVEDNFTWMNQFSTISSYVLGASMIPFFWNVYITWRSNEKVEMDDPWGFGASLEWATSCPPPRHNFTSLPRIRSARPALDLHHPELRVRSDEATHSPAADVPFSGPPSSTN
jgi:cytochrome c oxidase subunit 1